MKRTHKKIFGFCGLLLVVAMTVFAAFLPGPNTKAADDVTSVTDTIKVRVVGSVPRVDIIGINNGEVITVPRQSFTMDYENSHTVKLTLRHTDLDGNVQEKTLDIIDADYYAGSETYNIRFIDNGSAIEESGLIEEGGE